MAIGGWGWTKHTHEDYGLQTQVQEALCGEGWSQVQGEGRDPGSVSVFSAQTRLCSHAVRDRTARTCLLHRLRFSEGSSFVQLSLKAGASS